MTDVGHVSTRAASSSVAPLMGVLKGRTTKLVPTILIVLSAALMIVSGIVHIHLWDIAYRHVKTLGPLFMVQAIAALVLALALVVTRRGALMLAAMGLMAGTIVGFILVATVGLFGFKLPEITNWAILALVVEGLAVLLLGAATLQILHERS
jgi:hypothetical protein